MGRTFWGWTMGLFALLIIGSFAWFAATAEKDKPIRDVTTGLTAPESVFFSNTAINSVAPNMVLLGYVDFEDGPDGKQVIANTTKKNLVECTGIPMNENVTEFENSTVACPQAITESFPAKTHVLKDGEKVLEEFELPGMEINRADNNIESPITITVIDGGKPVGTLAEFVNAQFERVDESCDLTLEPCEVK